MRSNILLTAAFIASLATPAFAQCVEEEKAETKPQPVASVEKPAQPAADPKGG